MLIERVHIERVLVERVLIEGVLIEIVLIGRVRLNEQIPKTRFLLYTIQNTFQNEY